MQVTTSEFRRGLKIEYEGQPYEIVEYQFVKPGKGTPFTRTRMKHLLTGNMLEENIRSGEKVGMANTEEHTMSYIYQEGEFFTFMNNETFDQVQLTEEQLGDARKYLMENIEARVLFYNGRAIGVELPNFVVMEITYCEPGVKGDTATGATKPATLATGATILVPLFVEQGEFIRIDTRSDSYIERVKK